MTADPEPLARTLDEIASVVARQNPITLPIVAAELKAVNLSGWTEKQILRTMRKAIVEYHRRGQLGRLRAALLVGTTFLGHLFVIKAERAGVFLSPKVPSPKFDKFLTTLRSESDGTENQHWNFLHDRLQTYLSYREFAVGIAQSESRVLPHLRVQPRHVIQKVLSLACLNFLQKYFGFESAPGVREWLDHLGSPEDVASIASVLVALANDYRPLDSYDFMPPMTSDLATPEVRELIEYGRAVFRCSEVAKDISHFGYRLEKIDVSSTRKVFYLRPPMPEFEYGRKLGFIRSEMGITKAALEANANEDVTRFSLLAAAEAFATEFRDNLQDIKDEGTPFRRVRIVYTTGPKLFEIVSQTNFSEDERDRERLSQDFIVPMAENGGEKIQLTAKLGLETFLNIWRYFQFLCLVDIYVLRPFASTDPMMLCNSLLRVSREESSMELLTSAGFSEAQAQEFFRLVSAETQNLGYYDLQYRPFLRIAPVTIGNVTSPAEIVYLPAAIAIANAFRNVQASNRIRIAANADLFVRAVERILRLRFSRVLTNRPVKGSSGGTDIDVLVWEGRSLFLFECKHSLPPTSPHEMRDLWEDIEKGVGQLKTAMVALAEPSRLAEYLRNWFPDASRSEISEVCITPCVLCSHRIFSGTSHEGVPIRDFSSLTKLVENGVIGMGSMGGGESVMCQYRVVSEGGFSFIDLSDYLTPESKFFQIFRPFMSSISRLDALGTSILARETFTYTVELADWLDHMDGLGFSRLADERRKWTPPWTAKELLSGIDKPVRRTEQA